jgi:hypothetical protein
MIHDIRFWKHDVDTKETRSVVDDQKRRSATHSLAWPRNDTLQRGRKR